MREIKFRAWHFKLNKMFTAEEMTHDQMALLPDGHFANIHGGDTSKSTIYPHTSMMPLQFTGLYDKNGKEIYEGDIVKDNLGLIDGNGEVYWTDHGAWCVRHGDHADYLVWNIAKDRLEVIGNIYENTKP